MTFGKAISNSFGVIPDLGLPRGEVLARRLLTLKDIADALFTGNFNMAPSVETLRDS
jgi:hypothetical protein